MKTSLDHLPADTRDKLAAMVEIIRAEVPDTGLILLFGSHARGEQVSDPETAYYSDYDLLVVVESPTLAHDALLWARVRAALQPIAHPAVAQVLVHDLRDINQEIRRGQFFFAEIVGQGIVLYDSRRFTLARPKAATAEERRALTQEYFEHWFESAAQFFTYYEDGMARGWKPIAAFQLHQAAERYFATALLVFTGTKPTTHDLEKLSALVAPLHPLLAEPFPRVTKEDQHLFDLLRRAYIEARYKKSYRITAEELGALGPRVSDFAARVERACRERIAGLG